MVLSRVQVAVADYWQAEGLLRVDVGGAVAELPGVRLMASGLDHPQWNSGDVTDPALFDLDSVAAWYAARADGRGVPWGLRVPVGLDWRAGELVMSRRLMVLDPAHLTPAPLPPGVAIRAAGPADLDVACRVDAEAFGDDPARNRGWMAPQLDAEGWTVLLAEADGTPVGSAIAVVTDGRAGRCGYVGGVGVLEPHRGRGIGAALSAAAAAVGVDAGAELVHLSPDTDAAARLYARLGFSETAGYAIYVHRR
ncbi:MAG TPA: GNAT family N-acetyltransferase [Motilibacteraceae bacterium]|nr:GNAT family N-acetyltransferase [Motilibacteraceae bacterium]